MFFLHLLLVLIWMIFRQRFSIDELLIGFLIGFVAIVAAQMAGGSSRYGQRAVILLGLGSFVLWSIVRSNLALARIILMRNPPLRPGIIGVPLDLQSDAAIALLAHLISLTPGTLSLELASDKRVLYVHTIFVHEPRAFQRTIKRELESRVADILDEKGRHHV